MAAPSLDEFALIAEYFAPLAANFPGALRLQDDAALVDVPEGQRVVVTTDALVAGVHFFPDDPPGSIARKALRVNISDVAAMGGRPTAILLAACFPDDVTDPWLREFAAGLAEDCREYGISLIGGDTVATPGPLSLTVTALGLVAAGRELRRDRARVGDRVYVSGSIGDAALGLEVLKGGLALPQAAADHLVARYRLPQPRVALGWRLAGLAHAAMDVSDGLYSDLGHICRASGLGATVDADRIPLSAAARMAIRERPDLMTLVLSGGDDYELLFTAPATADPIISTLAGQLGLELTPIGSIIETEGLSVVNLPKGAAVTGGFMHFRGGK